MSGSLDRLAGRLVPWLIRHRKVVLLSAALVTVVSVFFAAKLYGDLRSEIEELLPADAPSVVAARTVGPQLHSVNSLSIVMEGTDGDAIARFADDLVERLKKEPPDLIESIQYRTDEEKAFAQQFGMLFLDKADLITIRDRIRARVAWEKQKANPLLDIAGEEDEEEKKPPPSLDFSDIEAKYGNQREELGHFRNGYFQTPDGKLLAILVRPPEAATGYEFNKRLLDTAKRLVAELDPKKYDPTLRVGYDSEVTSLVEEQEALVADLASSTAVVVVMVLAVLFFYFRRWKAIGAILGSLAVGCAVTFALSYFAVGHLNANTGFLGSIVLGNGINVAIIITARYREERRLGTPVEDAIRIAWRSTFAATFVAAFAAALSYLSLAVTSFRGFNQFGIIGGIGMATCWVTAYLLLPPLLAAIETVRPMNFARHATGHPLTARLVELIERHARALRVTSVLLLLACVGAVFAYKGPLLEYDVSKLRAQKSIKSGATYWGHKQDQIFRAYLTPIVIVGDTPADLDQVVATLDRNRKALGKGDPIREVRTLKSVLPSDQESKIAVANEIRDELTPARLKLLPKDVREQVELLLPPKPVRPATVKDLPASLQLPLVERNGEVGKVALAFPAKVGVLNPNDLDELTQLIRGSIAETGGRARAVSQQLLFADIASAITRDGPKATGIALFAVLSLVVLVFRRLKPSLLTCGSLLLGVAFLIGAAAADHVRINFLNFVVLPITFGIGVDYAVNIVQRYRIEGSGSLKRVLLETGGAVALCSVTTIIGYASLLVADNRALQGFGLLASLGELTCITTALVFLPAWMLKLDRAQP